MIEIDDVVKSYAGRRVVDRVGFAVAEGEFCALVGSSGSGKSTTLKMVNRLVTPTEGAIRVGGEDVRRVPAEALRRRIGYAIQSVGLFPHWTVADNIATVPRLLKWPEPRVRRRIEELLELLRLEPALAGRYPHSLSGGQQQRVGVARALAADPALLLMDEPFGALDPITRDALQEELRRIHRLTGKTILFVTHDMDEALRLADRIVILHEGRLVQAATPRDIVEHPAGDFVREFVGRAELGLKRLAVRRVGEHLRPGETADGDPVGAEASLRDALSEMVLRGVDRLAVTDGAGRPAGAIRLQDIVA